MKFYSVKSSNVLAIAYSQPTKIFAAVFKGAAGAEEQSVYVYAGVEQETWDEIIKPDVSIGKFINTNIKGKPVSRLEGVMGKIQTVPLHEDVRVDPPINTPDATLGEPLNPQDITNKNCPC
jgi:hypothetical protein